MADEHLTEEPEDLTVLALSPEQMAPAQERLIAWVGDKLRALRSVQDEQGRSYEAATRLPFSDQMASWRRELDRTTREIGYYERLEVAMGAGYLVVPDFPLDVFAIRTKAKTPTGSQTGNSWRPTMLQQPKALPPGEGRYVSPRPVVEGTSDKVPDGKGGEMTQWYWEAVEFRDVAIPVRLVRPEILSATARAMALKVFDEIGLVGPVRPVVTRGFKGDPIIAGRIRHPRYRSHDPRGATFFIAWWLDTRTL